MTPGMLVATLSRVLATERSVSVDFANASEFLKDCTPALTVLASINVDLASFPAGLESALLRLGAGPENSAETGPARLGETTCSAQLGFLYGRLNEATLACAALHAVAHRSGEGNLADLAEGHSLAYLTAAAAIGEVVSEVAIWELEQVGEECQCHCGSCALGVCLCARHGKETVAKARQASAVRPGEQGIALRQARAGSPAARAGLEPGDVIVAVGERDIAAPIDLLQAIRDLGPEVDVELTLARNGTVTGKTALRRS